jgi:hypothetical protein
MSAQREPNLALPRTFAPFNLLTGTAGVPPAMSAQREQVLLSLLEPSATKRPVTLVRT